MNFISSSRIHNVNNLLIKGEIFETIIFNRSSFAITTNIKKRIQRKCHRTIRKSFLEFQRVIKYLNSYMHSVYFSWVVVYFDSAVGRGQMDISKKYFRFSRKTTTKLH